MKAECAWRMLSAGCVAYEAALAWQRELVAMRSRGECVDTLLLLEHPPTITLGRGAKQSNIRASAAALAAQGVAVVQSDRGGDVTYHAPGQLVGYPIFKLSQHGGDVLRYLRLLEEVIIATLATYAIAATRQAGLTGVWVTEPTAGHPAKIAAIGVKLSASGITSHGFALNIAPDMAGFGHIIPCGIRDYGVTSMAQLLAPALPPPRHEVEQRIVAQMCRLFELDG